MTVTKKSPEKVGMRPGGQHGQKLEQAKVVVDLEAASP
jgi:hypothetical protein